MTVHVKFLYLNLQFKKGQRNIEFAQNVTFINGQMGVGKSTVARLIDYCFGGKLVKTVAISEEFVSAELFLELGENLVSITRNIDDSNILVNWANSQNQSHQLIAPIRSSEIIWNEDIENFSDMMFYLMGFKPLKVRISKEDDSSELIRLSFRDILWYCYLKQNTMDSDFYRLGIPIQQNKSKDVMRFFTGQYNEKIFELQNELSQIIKKKLGKLEAVNQLHVFLRKFGYESDKQIIENLEKLKLELSFLQSDFSLNKEKMDDETHIADRLKENLRLNEIASYRSKIYDIENKILDQESLKAELFGAKIKLYRASSAISVLNRVNYEYCPECGNKLDELGNYVIFHLCKTDKTDISPNINKDTIEKDLNDRVKELDESIMYLNMAFSNSKKKITELMDSKKELDNRLTKEMTEYDSKFMSLIKDRERNIATTTERIKNLTQVLEMPLAVKDLEIEASALASQETRLRIDLEKEREKLEFSEDHIRAIESAFLDALISIGIPGISSTDRVHINRKTWVPFILPDSNPKKKWDFFNAGSGGKQTLLNVCYAISVHKVAIENNLPVPDFLIIDSPSKNIDKDVNIEIFEGLFRYIYTLSETSMKSTQFIIIDNDLVDPDSELIDFKSILMTHDDPEFPPLIPYYKGP